MPDHPFIQRWQKSAAAERANYQLFLSELCDYLGVPRPDPAVSDDRQNQYVFERPVTFHHPGGSSSTGLYRRGCFVLEAKQGSEAPNMVLLFEAPRRRGAGIRGTTGWDEAMLRARNQAEQYAKALPVSDGWPPFLVVVDVGYSIASASETIPVITKLGASNYSRSPTPTSPCGNASASSANNSTRIANASRSYIPT